MATEKGTPLCTPVYRARAQPARVAVSFPLQHREQLCVRQDLVVDRQALLSVISSASSEVCVCVWRTKRRECRCWHAPPSCSVCSHMYSSDSSSPINAAAYTHDMNAHDVTARGPMLRI